MDGFKMNEQNEPKTTNENGGNTMKKFFAKRLKNEKGLTLIELLAVIVILAIIAAIAVPAIGNIISNSRDSAKLAAASNILAGAKIAATDNACEEESDGSIKCVYDVLNDGYVENVKGDDAYSAEKSSDGVWTVKYSELKDWNSKKYGGVEASGSIDEPTLNEVLEGKEK